MAGTQVSVCGLQCTEGWHPTPREWDDLEPTEIFSTSKGTFVIDQQPSPAPHLGFLGRIQAFFLTPVPGGPLAPILNRLDSGQRVSLATPVPTSEIAVSQLGFVAYFPQQVSGCEIGVMGLGRTASSTRLKHEWLQESANVRLFWHPDRLLLCASSSEEFALVWDVRSMELIAEWSLGLQKKSEHFGHRCNALGFGQGPGSIYLSSLSKGLRLVDLATRDVISRLGSHAGRLELDGSGSAMSNAKWAPGLQLRHADFEGEPIEFMDGKQIGAFSLWLTDNRLLFTKDNKIQLADVHWDSRGFALSEVATVAPGSSVQLAGCAASGTEFWAILRNEGTEGATIVEFLSS